MSNFKSRIAKSAVSAVVIGALVAAGLYVLSTWFFNAKNKQTLIQSTELGTALGGERVFPIGAKLPSFEFEDLLSGHEYIFEEDPAPLKVVNFWASWCEPCVEEFSSFARLIKKFEGRLSFVGISEDKTVQGAKEFLRAFNVDFKDLEGVYFGYDEGKVLSDKFGILALPETFLVDSEGKLIRRVSGFEKWDAPGAIEYFRSLIEQQEQKSKKKAAAHE